MPTLRAFCRELGWDCRRWRQVYGRIRKLEARPEAAGREGLEAITREGEAAMHSLNVTWDAITAQVGVRRRGEKRLFVTGRATGDVRAPRVYLASKHSPSCHVLVFLPSLVEIANDKWGNPVRIELDGKEVSRGPDSLRQMGSVAVNGEAVGEMALSYAPAGEWSELGLQPGDLVAQGRVVLPDDFVARVAKECGKDIG